MNPGMKNMTTMIGARFGTGPTDKNLPQIIIAAGTVKAIKNKGDFLPLYTNKDKDPSKAIPI